MIKIEITVKTIMAAVGCTELQAKTFMHDRSCQLKGCSEAAIDTEIMDMFCDWETDNDESLQDAAGQHELDARREK